MANQIPENAPGFFDVHLFIDPQDMKVAGMFAYSYFGISVRKDNDWIPAMRDETRLDEFSRFIDYEIDWDVDYKPVSDLADDEELTEHALVLAFDNDEITWEMINKYCVLVHDENGENPNVAIG